MRFLLKNYGNIPYISIVAFSRPHTDKNARKARCHFRYRYNARRLPKKHHSPFFTFAILPGIYSETSQKTTSKDIGIMRTGLLTAAVAAMLMLTASASVEARGPHRHGGCYGRHYGCYATAVVPTFRTVQVERTTTVNKTSRPERKLMAVAYIQKNGYLSVSKYCGFTGLDSKFAEAELDSFTLDRKTPLVRTMQGKKIVYTLADE